MGRGCKKAQSILEYTVLFSLILAGLLMMQVYVKRAYQGRIKQDAEQLGPQYSPGHSTSLTTTQSTTDTTTYIGGQTTDGRTVPDGMTLGISNIDSSFEKRESVDSFNNE
jgi:hypothetical protein